MPTWKRQSERSRPDEIICVLIHAAISIPLAGPLTHHEAQQKALQILQLRDVAVKALSARKGAFGR